MDSGLYEKIIDDALKEKIEQSINKETRNIDDSELPRVLSISYQKRIRELISSITDKSEREIFLNELNDMLKLSQYDQIDHKFQELLAIHEEKDRFDELVKNRPRTSIASSTLFTGFSGPTLESELSKEIRTADEVCFLVSFIKYSGLRLIFDDLVELTKIKRFRVITTSYMGASDYKAILELSKLPNTEVKISFDTKRTRLHAKAYFFKRNTGFSTAYIGSSNISNPALSNGLEWNLKISEYTSKDVVDSFIKNFETYWNDDEFITFDPNDEQVRGELKESLQPQTNEDSMAHTFFNLKPYSHQREILEDLRLEREEYNSYRNLVVAATGTGKTMIAAFDYKSQIEAGDKQLLFLAHRKEILEQSLFTFRNVLKDQNFGELWVDGSEPSHKDHVFASIQTLNSNKKYEDFSPNYFDYVVIDESHHATASTYLRILDYLSPEILLGLTATPERMDGGNILEHFNGRIASEIRLTDAINRKLLSPFHYFGVSDPEDLSHLRWTRGGYEIDELENVYTKSKQRVQVIIDAMDRYLKDLHSFKAIGFCVSKKHADFMAESFNKAQIPSISLHSDVDKEIRKVAKRKLQKGEIKCIFTVDLFNEGVDIPDVDTVLFLRPTESLTIFIQQLGRGLRLSDNKEALTVLDFVGRAHENYDFTFKLRTLTGKTRQGIREEINDDFPNMPIGCHIKLEKIAKEYILNNIQSAVFNISDLRKMIKNFGLIFSVELNLKNFLDNYGIDKERFFSRYSFVKLLVDTGLKEKYLAQNPIELKNALRRFSQVDSKRLLDFAKNVLSSNVDVDNLSDIESKMLGMLHYTVWGDKPDRSYLESLKILKENNQDIVSEILSIIDYNKKSMKTIEMQYEDNRVPFDIYASYSIDQIMVAIGKTNENHKYPMREGVYYSKEINTDLFFITINKNEGDYLPSTMYNDYAISSELFNWESQSTTGISTPTGQRYINDKSEEHKVLLFVREYKQKYNQAQPYTFLGNARYVSHKGEKPIQIVWKMDHPIPEKIIKESSLRVVN